MPPKPRLQLSWSGWQQQHKGGDWTVGLEKVQNIFLNGSAPQMPETALNL